MQTRRGNKKKAKKATGVRVRPAQSPATYDAQKVSKLRMFPSVRGDYKLSSGSVASKFVCALDDPFCVDSYGAKVPDQFQVQTEVMTIKARCTYTPASNAYVIFTPNPGTAALSLVGTGTTAPPLFSASGAGLAVSLPLNTIVNNVCTVPVYQATTASTFASTVTSYRNVGWGVRIRNITAAQSVAGDITVAKLPMGAPLPSQLLYIYDSTNCLVSNPGTRWTELTSSFSLPVGGTNYSLSNQSYSLPQLSVLDTLPMVEVYSGAEIAQTGGIVLKPTIHSPSAWNFRPANPTVGTFQSGTAVYSSGSIQGGSQATVPFLPYNEQAFEFAGHNCLLFAGTGTGQTYEFEFVYHLETIPCGAQTNPSQSQMSPKLPAATFDRLVDAVMASPWVEFVKHEGQRAIGNTIRALPGLLTNMAITAMV